MVSAGLPVVAARDVRFPRADPVDGETLERARSIVGSVRDGGEVALRAAIAQFEGRRFDPLVLDREQLKAAYKRLAPDTRGVLERTCSRITNFARAQRACLAPLEMAVPGGRAGHDLEPVARAGCYAPGGNYPLPSSVLMTAATARAAGVGSVVVASPSSDDLMLGAAWLAGADEFLHAGGAHAIAALSYGFEGFDAVDFVAGPGNRWVTAAKAVVIGRVGVDMLAGPSELVVIADETADPELVAADLLGQAEHDVDAIVRLVTTNALVAQAVSDACASQLAQLETRQVAGVSLAQGASIVCSNRQELIDVVNRCAPEHLELHCAQPGELLRAIQHYGGAFLGTQSAEVFGDYGVGPNHVLPTGGTARHTGGLSVLSFIRVRTWLALDAQAPDEQLIADVAALADCEGLAAHAASARQRLRRPLT